MAPRLSLIVAIGTSRAIGRDNQLPWYLPADLVRFKKLTTNHPIIMGRKTFESLPNGALPNRTNIVITRDPSYQAPGAKVVTSLEAALEEAKKNEDQEVFVIGGAQIFALALPLADRVYMTIVETAPEADIFFPELGPEWHETEREKYRADEKNKYNYAYATYENTKASV